MVLTFTDFLELVCRFADKLARGNAYGALPWNKSLEGDPTKLATTLVEFLEVRLGLVARKQNKSNQEAPKATMNALLQRDNKEEASGKKGVDAWQAAEEAKIGLFERGMQGGCRSLAGARGHRVHERIRSCWRDPDITKEAAVQRVSMTFDSTFYK
jgi:hypothetical protein